LNRQSTIHAIAAEFGFALHRTGKHLIWRHPCGAQVVTPITPSDRRSLQNMRGNFKRELTLKGLDPMNQCPA
jgi:predicted RNA binding protein YcfA (HicA-like mRNA interferase family)